MLRCLSSDRLTDLPNLAAATPGFLPADLALLITRLSALETVTSGDIEEELVRNRPATLRSGLGSVHSEAVTWDSLGGLEQEKLGLRVGLEEDWNTWSPVQQQGLFRSFVSFYCQAVGPLSPPWHSCRRLKGPLFSLFCLSVCV